MPTTSLPVLLYHYVSNHADSIAVSPARFEEHCRAMRKAGYTGVSLDQAVEHLARGASLPAKSALITFDDGYLDNYAYAWPILQTYGHSAAIFAATSKLEAAGPLRPTSGDLCGGVCKPDEFPRVDHPFQPGALGLPERRDLFLNWSEAKRLEDAGIAVAAHTSRHISVFKGPTFKGERSLFKPEPRTRAFDRIDAPVLFGLPRFETQPLQCGPAFLVSEELRDLARLRVPQNPLDAAEFFQDPAKEAELWRAIDAIPVARWGALEREDEHRRRLYDELKTCRDALASQLSHADAPRRQALAWPWGKFSPAALELGRELGFRVFFATSFGANPPGACEAVHRFKARDKSGAWLLSRLFVYSRPWLARLYAAVRL